MMSCEFSKPAGFITLPIEAETLLRKAAASILFDIFLIACAANFGVVTLKKTSAFSDFNLTMWRRSKARRFHSFLDNDHRSRLGTETVPQTLHVILAVVVVLIQHGDFRVGFSFRMYLA